MTKWEDLPEEELAKWVGCGVCKHYNGITCAAYPDGIPMPIQSWDMPHTRHFPDDNGYLFERDDKYLDDIVLEWYNLSN